MALGCTVSVVQSGSAMTIPVEQVYASATSNTAATLIVSITIPNLQGVTASTPGPYIIDTFKVMLRHQNTHALTNAAFVLNVTFPSLRDRAPWYSAGPSAGSINIISSRLYFGGVGQQIFRALRTEAALTGQFMNQVRARLCIVCVCVCVCGRRVGTPAAVPKRRRVVG
jgi:CO/xanthine dehydrogenase FAD-binding subunit